MNQLWLIQSISCDVDLFDSPVFPHESTLPAGLETSG